MSYKKLIINTFDLETFKSSKQIKNNRTYIIEPYLACFYLNNKHYSFYGLNCVNDSIDSIFELVKEDTEFFIHNLSYDSLIILPYLNLNKFKISILNNGMNMLKLKIWQRNKSGVFISFQCSFNLFPFPLKVLGESINIKKLPFPYLLINSDKYLNYKGEISTLHSIIKPKEKNYLGFNSKDDYDEYIKLNGSSLIDFKEYSIKYCERDVLITSEFMVKYYSYFHENYKGTDEIPLTISSLAIKLIKNNPIHFQFEDKKIPFYSNDEQQTIHGREAYFGGRCEKFGNALDGHKIFHFDFTGFYPSNGLGNFGYGELKRWKKHMKIDYKNFKKGIYKVRVLSKNMFLPILGRKINNKMIFANGDFTGWYDSEELSYFYSKGGIIKEVLDGWYYEKEAPIFKKYFETFINFRNVEPIKINKIIGKALNNCLYGRLAMEDKNTMTIILSSSQLNSLFINSNSVGLDTNPKNFSKNSDIVSLHKSDSRMMELNFIEIKTEVFIRLKKLYDKDKKTYEFLNFTEDYDPNLSTKKTTNILAAASITARGRVMLHKALTHLIEIGGHLLYSDTDSIFVSFKDGKDKWGVDILDRDIISDPFILRFDSSKKDTIIKKAVFKRPKEYSLVLNDDTKISKLKGIPHNRLDHDKIFEAFTNDKTLVFDNVSFNSKADFEMLYSILPFKSITSELDDKFPKRIKVDFHHTKPWYI